MTREDIASTIAKVPALNRQGIGLSNFHEKLTREEYRRLMIEEQEFLLCQAEACTRVCGWLEDKKKTKTINRRHSSYGLKHIAETEIGYIGNGAFIAAAIFMGFPYRINNESINPSFGISERSLKAIGKRIA